MPGTTPARRLTLAEVAERLGVHYMTAYRYVRDGRLEARKDGTSWSVDVRDLEAFDRRGRTGAPPPASDLSPRFLERLLRADEEGAWRVVQQARDRGTTPAHVLTDLVAPALATVGDRWARGETTVGQEHLASATATRIIARLSPLLARRGPPRAHVVIGAAPNDAHALPSAIVRDLLRSQGLSVTDLGANVPAHDWGAIVAAASRAPGPPLVAAGLCATTAGHAQQVRAALLSIRAASDVQIVVGGHGITSSQAARDLGADHYTRSAVEAVALFDALAEGGD
jgi:excisionase family DNA binding protein